MVVVRFFPALLDVRGLLETLTCRLGLVRCVDRRGWLDFYGAALIVQAIRLNLAQSVQEGEVVIAVVDHLVGNDVVLVEHTAGRFVAAGEAHFVDVGGREGLVRIGCRVLVGLGL